MQKAVGKVKAEVTATRTTAEEQLLVAEELAEQALQQLAAEQARSESLVRELKRTQQMEQTWREIAWKASHREPKVPEP